MSKTGYSKEEMEQSLKQGYMECSQFYQARIQSLIEELKERRQCHKERSLFCADNSVNDDCIYNQYDIEITKKNELDIVIDLLKRRLGV